MAPLIALTLGVTIVVGLFLANIYFPLLGPIFSQTGISQALHQSTPPDMFLPLGVGQLIMIVICLGLLYLGIKKKFEPLLLIPIAIGGFLSNIPGTGLLQEGGLLYTLYHFGIPTGIFPLIIFIGIGAMTDFGPLIANPKTALLGGAAQFAIFGTFLGACAFSTYFPDIFSVSLKQAASIAIIGGADGPTSIFVAGRLAPELLGAIAVAAYSYMALVPVIQPPIMRALTTKKEKQIEMTQLREVSQREKILFPLIVMLLTALLIPLSLPLIGMLMFGNLLKETGVTDRLSKTAQGALMDMTVIFLGISVGSKLSAELFLKGTTLFVLILGILAFCLGTASGVLMAKFMNLFSRHKMNPFIGAAGVSAVPMAARVAQKLGQEYNPNNQLLMHAMGPNVAGCIGSALAAGILLALCS